MPMLSLCLPAHSGLKCEKSTIFWEVISLYKTFLFPEKKPRYTLVLEHQQQSDISEV